MHLLTCKKLFWSTYWCYYYIILWLKTTCLCVERFLMWGNTALRFANDSEHEIILLCLANSLIITNSFTAITISCKVLTFLYVNNGTQCLQTAPCDCDIHTSWAIPQYSSQVKWEWSYAVANHNLSHTTASNTKVDKHVCRLHLNK